MKGSAGRMYGIALGSAAAVSLFDYAAERHGHKLEGRLAIGGVIGWHLIGGGLALRFCSSNLDPSKRSQ